METITQNMTVKITKNNVSAILSNKGMDNVRPTSDLLATLGINRRRFRALINNEVRMNPLEIKAFAKWLQVPESEIIGGE